MTRADPRVWEERQSDIDFADFLSRCHAYPSRRRVVVYPVGGICTPEHPHADDQGCYTHGCRCPECTQGKTDYAFWRKHMHRAGRGPVQSIDGRGTRRRVEALMAIGWPAGELGRRAGGATFQTVNLWRTRERVAPATAAKVAALFDGLWNQRPEPVTRGEKGAVAKTLTFARSHGFLPPLAWDDIDADEHAPTPDGEHEDVDHAAVALAVAGDEVDLTPADRRAAVRILHGERMSDWAIAKRLRCSDRTVLRIRQELELPEVFGQIEWRPRPSEGRAAA